MPLRVATRPPAKPDAEVVVDGRGLSQSLKREFERQWVLRSVAVTATLGRARAQIVIGLRLPGEAGARRAAWRGDPLAVARLFGESGRTLTRERIRRAAVVLPALPSAEIAAAVVTGLDRGLYTFDRYKTTPASHEPSVTLVAATTADAALLRRALPIASGVRLTRDLINTPAEDMGPAELEAAARALAKQSGLSVRVLDAKRCARLGMGALTAVGRASSRPPRMIILEHRGAPRTKEMLAFAGKGVCFDTGGLNIKPAGGMLLMKKDMGGAATLLGVAHAVAKRAPKKNIRFYLAAAENSIAGNAIRPGDVVRALDGTTIEIGHTDAEGRLVLADAVALAVKEGAGRIIDVATLTGAALVALGRTRVPLVGSDAALLEAIEASSTATGERVWRFPTDPEYKEAIRGTVADLRNVGHNNEAGVLAGGLFIGHFAKDVPWAHLDISPASWSPAASAFGPAGATGAMVPTLTHLALA